MIRIIFIQFRDYNIIQYDISSPGLLSMMMIFPLFGLQEGIWPSKIMQQSSGSPNPAPLDTANKRSNLNPLFLTSWEAQMRKLLGSSIHYIKKEIILIDIRPGVFDRYFDYSFPFRIFPNFNE